MKALIDSDSILYKVCCSVEEKTIWNECEHEAGIEDEPIVTYSSDLDSCISLFNGIIENILFATECDDYELHFTGNSNFRNTNPLGYKANRKELRKPLLFNELKEYALNAHKGILNEEIEADDMVVYLKTKYPEDYLLCAIDKDVLYQTPGTHYDYNNDKVITVDEKDAIRFLYYQCLVGDTSDGYIGCRGVGKVNANKLLGDVKHKLTNLEYATELYRTVEDAYIKKGHTIDDFLNTLKLADMHQIDVINNKVKIRGIKHPTDPFNTGV